MKILLFGPEPKRLIFSPPLVLSSIPDTEFFVCFVFFSSKAKGSKVLESSKFSPLPSYWKPGMVVHAVITARGRRITEPGIQ